MLRTSYIKFKDHEFYLSIFVDGFNNEILYWTITKSMDTFVIFKNLEKDFLSKLDVGQEIIIHTDHGTQYKSDFYIMLCKKYNIKRSLSRVGKSIDNGLVESIFGRLKIEFFRNKNIKFHNVDDFLEKFSNYVIWYNNKRNVRRLGTNPNEYKKLKGY